MATEPGDEVRVARLDDLDRAGEAGPRVARVAGFEEVGGATAHESVATFADDLREPDETGAAPVAAIDEPAGDTRDGGVARVATGLAGAGGEASPSARTATLGRLGDKGAERPRRRNERAARQAGPADGGGSEKPAITRKRPAGRRGAPAELDRDADPVAVAREICLRLLTERSRTRQELAQALRRKGVPEEAAGAVLDRFDEVGLIDDAAFAGQWVRSRHNQRGLARRAIAVELRRKGVADDVAGEALAEVDAESEEQRARELVDRKLRSLTVATAEQRAAAGRRLVGMLARKGYGAGVAYRVVREALAEHGADVEELGYD